MRQLQADAVLTICQAAAELGHDAGCTPEMKCPPGVFQVVLQDVGYVLSFALSTLAICVC
jgi:hypothetical protein